MFIKDIFKNDHKLLITLHDAFCFLCSSHARCLHTATSSLIPHIPFSIPTYIHPVGMLLYAVLLPDGITVIKVALPCVYCVTVM